MTKKEQDKVEKELPEFAALANSAATMELNAKIAELTKGLEEVREALKNNEKIHNAREELKLLTGPFNDAKKTINLKIRYLIDRVKDRGMESFADKFMEDNSGLMDDLSK